MLLSTVCEAFNCPPDVARRQSWRDVVAVLDYRAARRGVDLFNGGARGRDELSQHPELAALLLEMCRAQAGDDALTLDQAYAGLAATRPARDDEDDEEA